MGFTNVDEVPDATAQQAAATLAYGSAGTLLVLRVALAYGLACSSQILTTIVPRKRGPEAPLAALGHRHWLAQLA